MSDDSQGSREWRFYVKDMIECAEKVLFFTDGMDQDTFLERIPGTMEETDWCANTK